ncbi:hypothetical protein DERF_006010 [Dermatophagoides farinae]|uniref:Uncharacterized protein n=1 Tax=Dermatophagoides farinae TaxID=6954 RepID=A0A922I833_DERFA|nr:hypothetical protein DERF_006010 [Dermatophagoides farinae]
MEKSLLITMSILLQIMSQLPNAIDAFVLEKNDFRNEQVAKCLQSSFSCINCKWKNPSKLMGSNHNALSKSCPTNCVLTNNMKKC